MATINPYISFAGKAAEALELYKSVFGGETEINYVKDSPMVADMPAEMGELVFHSVLRSGSIEIMASDLSDPNTAQVWGNNIAIGVGCDSEAQINAFHAALSVDAQNTVPLSTVPWGAIYGEVTDKFGVRWMLNYDKPA